MNTIEPPTPQARWAEERSLPIKMGAAPRPANLPNRGCPVRKDLAKDFIL